LILFQHQGLDVIASARVASLREEISAWISAKQAARHVTALAAATPTLPKVPTPPPVNRPITATDLESPCQPTKSARRSSVFTPVAGTSLTGTLKQDPPAEIALGVLRAAVATAEGFASPKERWKKIFNTFKAVKGMGPSEKQTLAFHARLEADPSLATARATEIEVRDGSTLLHAAAAWGNANAVRAFSGALPLLPSLVFVLSREIAAFAGKCYIVRARGRFARAALGGGLARAHGAARGVEQV
jgi:hypothetical protein